MNTINLTQEQLANIIANAVSSALLSASNVNAIETVKESKQEVKKTSKKSVVKENKTELQKIESVPIVESDVAFQAVFSRFMSEAGTALPHKFRSFVSKYNYSTYKSLSLICTGKVEFNPEYNLSNGKTAGEAMQDLFNASISNGFISPLDFIADNRSVEKIKCADTSIDSNSVMVASKGSRYATEDSKVLKDIAKLEQVQLSREDLLKLYDDQLTKLGL